MINGDIVVANQIFSKRDKKNFPFNVRKFNIKVDILVKIFEKDVQGIGG